MHRVIVVIVCVLHLFLYCIFKIYLAILPQVSNKTNKLKCLHDPELTVNYSHSSVMWAVGHISPTYCRYLPGIQAGTKLYCLVTEAQQLAQRRSLADGGMARSQTCLLSITNLMP